MTFLHLHLKSKGSPLPLNFCCGRFCRTFFVAQSFVELSFWVHLLLEGFHHLWNFCRVDFCCTCVQCLFCIYIPYLKGPHQLWNFCCALFLMCTFCCIPFYCSLFNYRDFCYGEFFVLISKIWRVPLPFNFCCAIFFVQFLVEQFFCYAGTFLHLHLLFEVSPPPLNILLHNNPFVFTFSN